ncbi:MAG: 5-formyltetrahydrofolate cyclo-ligase [Ilumatobacter sp.]
MPDQNEASASSIVEAKRDLRRRMRALRRGLADRPERSQRIIERLVSLHAVVDARRLLAYASVVGEVETDALFSWCADRGIETAVPEDDVEASWPDVIIVPGTAFTADGDRVRQGGGWYDRFLPARRDDAVVIGVAFAAQIVESIPTEDHDVRLDLVVTEDAVHGSTTRSHAHAPSEHPGDHV